MHTEFHRWLLFGWMSVRSYKNTHSFQFLISQSLTFLLSWNDFFIFLYSYISFAYDIVCLYLFTTVFRLIFIGLGKNWCWFRKGGPYFGHFWDECLPQRSSYHGNIYPHLPANIWLLFPILEQFLFSLCTMLFSFIFNQHFSCQTIVHIYGLVEFWIFNIIDVQCAAEACQPTIHCIYVLQNQLYTPIVRPKH